MWQSPSLSFNPILLTQNPNCCSRVFGPEGVVLLTLDDAFSHSLSNAVCGPRRHLGCVLKAQFGLLRDLEGSRHHHSQLNPRDLAICPEGLILAALDQTGFSGLCQVEQHKFCFAPTLQREYLPLVAYELLL